MARRFLPLDRPRATLSPLEPPRELGLVKTAPEPITWTEAWRGTYGESLEHDLVLCSQDIPHVATSQEDGAWAIAVPSPLHSRAVQEIRSYIEENQATQGLQALPPLMLSAQPLWVLAIPTVATVVEFADYIPHFKERGMNDVSMTLHGEWWRVFTALTLHADGNHIVSNLISGYFVLSLLAGRIALTRIAPLLFLAAGLANFCVAHSVDNEFRSLGFSTFVFATLGALSCIEWRLLPKERTVGMFKRIEPLVSAFFIAVMMGIGENSDVLAHFYGFCWGVVAGLAPRRKSLMVASETEFGLSDWTAALTCMVGMAMCWKRALS